MLEEIILKYPDISFLKADGFDDAIIGVDINTNRLIYSFIKTIQILMNDMEYEDAIEYFYYNVLGSYVGENGPIWVDDDFINKPLN